jgi:phage terminase large subunit
MRQERSWDQSKQASSYRQSPLALAAQRSLAKLRLRFPEKSSTDDPIDPVEWIRVKLGEDKLWSKQEEIVRSVWTSDRKITGVVSGQKTGKTRIAADIAIEWTQTVPNGIVRLAATVEDQIKKELWQEITQTLRRVANQDWPLPALDPSTGWRFPDGRAIQAISAKSVNSIAGHSGANQLWIVDEACGFPEELWQVVLGNLMGGGKLLWLTNPTVTSGQAYSWVTLGGCHVIQIDSRENPNFHGGCLPGLATPEGVQMIFDTYGEQSAEADVRVYGRFPRQGSNAVMPLGLVMDAEERWEQTSAQGPLIIGVDVARFGDDDSVAVPRRGFKLLEPHTWHGLGNVELAGEVFALGERMRGNSRCVFIVEEDGVGGGVCDVMNAGLPSWATVIPVMVSSAADDNEHYVNRRTENWFRFRDFLKAGGAIEHSERLRSELVAPTYSFDPKLRYKVESKDEINTRLGRSPDEADAAILTTAIPVDSLSGLAELMKDIPPETHWA